MKILIFSLELKEIDIKHTDTPIYTSGNSMKLFKNVKSGCHGNHFIELGRANLTFLVLLLDISL